MKTFIFIPPLAGTTESTIQFLTGSYQIEPGIIITEDSDFDKYIKLHKPTYDAWCKETNTYTYLPTHEQVFAQDTINGYYDSIMNCYLSVSNEDQASFTNVMTSINTAIITKTYDLKDTCPFVIYGGTITNPNSKDVPITGSFSDISTLLLRQKLWLIGIITSVKQKVKKK